MDGYRLGTTSYIVPADIVTNVKALAGRVTDIELVLFESDEISNLPTRAELDELQGLAAGAGHSYTIHLPLDIELGSFAEEERQRSVQKCLRVCELTAPLEPFGYVLHFHGDVRGGAASVDPPRWQRALERSVQEILDSGVVAAHDLCVETLDYPYSLVEAIVSEAELSICLDVGHIFLYGHPLEEYVERYLDRCRVLHVHGIIEGRDHRALDGLPQEQLQQLRALFQNPSGPMRERVVTLEVFSEQDLSRSLPLAAKLIASGGGS